MASPELDVVVDMLRELNPFAGDDIHEMRALTAGASDAFQKPDDVRYEAATLSGVPAEWTTPDGADMDRVLVYFHGGGYTLCSAATHRGLVTNLARAVGARALNVDYRLAPEHPWPAAVDDAVAVYRALLGAGIDPARIALAGDSAGGGLTLATLVALRDAGDPLPAAAACISAWTDLSLSGASVEGVGDRDPMITADALTLMSRLYLDGVDPRRPLASPLFADHAGLPPLLLHVGTAERLLDDSTRLAERARDAGVDVSLEVWEDMIHVWHNFADVLPEGRQAIARIGEFLSKRLA